MKTIISASIIAAAIIIYGAMQMYMSNAQRYQFHVAERGSCTILRTVFDKRSGRIYYVNSGTCYDAVGGEETKRSVRKVKPEGDGE